MATMLWWRFCRGSLRRKTRVVRVILLSRLSAVCASQSFPALTISQEASLSLRTAQNYDYVKAFVRYQGAFRVEADLDKDVLAVTSTFRHGYRKTLRKGRP